jgi:hypothetical protein
VTITFEPPGMVVRTGSGSRVVFPLG